MERALDLGASAIIMVHNHHERRSDAVQEPTRHDPSEVPQAAGTLGLTVPTGIVIGRAGHTSFKGVGLLSRPSALRDRVACALTRACACSQSRARVPPTSGCRAKA